MHVSTCIYIKDVSSDLISTWYHVCVCKYVCVNMWYIRTCVCTCTCVNVWCICAYTCQHVYIYYQAFHRIASQHGSKCAWVNVWYICTRMWIYVNIHYQASHRIWSLLDSACACENLRYMHADYCIWSAISPTSNLNRLFTCLRLLCHVSLKREQ